MHLPFRWVRQLRRGVRVRPRDVEGGTRRVADDDARVTRATENVVRRAAERRGQSRVDAVDRVRADHATGSHVGVAARCGREEPAAGRDPLAHVRPRREVPHVDHATGVGRTDRGRGYRLADHREVLGGNTQVAEPCLLASRVTCHQRPGPCRRGRPTLELTDQVDVAGHPVLLRIDERPRRAREWDHLVGHVPGATGVKTCRSQLRPRRVAPTGPSML